MNEPSPTRISEEEAQLLGQITGQDDDAARRLYHKYRSELFRFGVSVLRDQRLAEEMVQETFIKLVQQEGRYDAKRGPVRNWLFTMARSVAYDIARRPSSRPLLPVEDSQLPPQYDSVDQALTVLTVDQALDKLPSIYGDVMRLVRDGFTHSEIAERLGIPVGTAKSRMTKAANMLRAELASLQSAPDAQPQTLPDSVDSFAREGDALDWLHEQGMRRGRSIPEFDLDETLAVVRNVANDQRLPDEPVQLAAARPDLAESAAARAAPEMLAEGATQPAEDLRVMTPSLAGVSGELQRASLRGESAMTAGALAIAKTDTREVVPHSARVWNYWLGGKDNYAVDREVGDQYKEIFPGIAVVARTSRDFLTRVVRYLAADAGMRQFLDIGTGLSTASNTHEVAQSVAPESRIVYVDNDPLVLAHARALLASSPEGACHYLDADIRNPAAILGAAVGMLDFSQPVALMLMGIMGHFTDEEAYPIVRQLLAGLPSGSYFALYDGANTNEAFNQAQEGYNTSGAVPYHLRSPEQFTRFFEGLELVEPGVVPVPHWRPDPGVEQVEIYSYCGVGRKP